MKDEISKKDSSIVQTRMMPMAQIQQVLCEVFNDFVVSSTDGLISNISSSLELLDKRISKVSHAMITAQINVNRKQNYLEVEIERSRLSYSSLKDAFHDQELYAASDQKKVINDMSNALMRMKSECSELKRAVLNTQNTFALQTRLDVQNLVQFCEAEHRDEIEALHAKHGEWKKDYKVKIKEKYKLKSQMAYEQFSKEREAILKIVKYECSEILSDAKSMFSASNLYKKLHDYDVKVDAVVNSTGERKHDSRHSLYDSSDQLHEKENNDNRQ